MAIVLLEMTRATAGAILAGGRPTDVHVADDYPTEFSVGVAQCVGADRQFGPSSSTAPTTTSSSARSVAPSSTRWGRSRSAMRSSSRSGTAGYATAAVEALVLK